MKKIFTSKKWLWALIPSILLLALLVFRLSLPAIIKSQINKKITEVEQEKNVALTIGNMDVKKCSLLGTTELELQDISLTANNCPDKFMSMDKLHTEIQIWHGFKITKEIKELDAQKVSLNVVKRGDYYNYPFLHKHTTSDSKRNYCNRFNRLLEALNRLCPDLLSIQQLFVETDIDNEKQQYALDNFTIKDQKLGGLLTIKPQSPENSQWNIKGEIDKKTKHYSGELQVVDGAKVASKEMKNADLQFDNATFNMQVMEETGRHVKLKLAGNVGGLQFFHHYIADQPVCIDKVGGDLDIEIFPDKLQINPSSTLRLNKAAIHPFFSYQKSKKKHIIFKIDEKKCPAQDVFSSLPEGLFTIVPQLKVHGNIDFSLLFDCDFANIDNMKFDFDIRSSDHSFGIDEGKELITQYNSPFTYVFVDSKPGSDEKLELEVPIDSAENPYFCSFENIPATLTGAILTSEDPSFFRHRGFIKTAIRNAMVADLQVGRLMRGGSTISMQLIKNLFLNRKKVFTRKIEELLLVWMIEDGHLITKERMFEIYVNIAEWGPEIIGIGEAAEFYFNKKPSEITLGESLYLASLIRAPKHYASTLDENNVPHTARQKEMRNVANKMLERGLITSNELAALDTRIHIIAVPREN